MIHFAKSTQWLCEYQLRMLLPLLRARAAEKVGRADRTRVGPVARRRGQQERWGPVRKEAGPKRLGGWSWSLRLFLCNRDLGHLGQGHMYLLPRNSVTGQGT